MDIIIGSGNRRMKTTIASGYARRKLARERPIEHAKDVGAIMSIIRRKRPQGV